jgi:hypothetical protein
MNSYELRDGEVLRTARKAHTCAECKRPITPGARYVEDLNDSPSYQAGTRYHPECSEASHRRADEWAHQMGWR